MGDESLTGFTTSGSSYTKSSALILIGRKVTVPSGSTYLVKYLSSIYMLQNLSFNFKIGDVNFPNEVDLV